MQRTFLPDQDIGVLFLFFLRVETLNPLTGINGHHNLAHACIGLFTKVPLLDLVQNGGFVQVGQFGHVPGENALILQQQLVFGIVGQ